MGWKGILLAILLILVVINYFSGGAIWEQVSQQTEGMTGQDPATFFVCSFGMYLMLPIYESGELWIPIPAIDDIFPVTILLIITYLLLRIGGIEFDSTKQKIIAFLIFFFGYWIALRLIGMFLVISAGEACISLMLDGNNLFRPLFYVSFLLGVPAIIILIVSKALKNE